MNTAALRPLLALIAVVAVLGALHVSQPVTLPVAFAGVLAVLFRPLQRRLEVLVPRWAGVTLVVLVFLLFLGLLAAGVGYGASAVADEWPRYRDHLQGLGVRLPEHLSSGTPSSSSLLSAAFQGVGALFSAGSLLLLIVVFLALLLLEADAIRARVTRAFGVQDGSRVADAFHRMSGEFERFVWVQALTGALAAVLSWLFLLIVGVPLAFVWGVLTLVLEFFPTVGSILAVLPPTLFAFVFGSAAQGVLVLIGLGVIQIGIGSFVNPLLQGGQLGLSTTVVAVSVVFWGWLWGVGGALIAVPLTAGIALLLAEFPVTRPLAALLGHGERR
ncbi:pheromone autoinducer 2 transporter (plasmid) [Deinococcus aetherius]|uniref:Pheromone autoinducer 2 transporter n=1 Tax=Deinococcus aetherius TaxID=200252 RepID=A0ABM8AK07_9DEIO|nr:AI-2E family transporter [Deinococcus aetherius]BDP44151.1 pheromone autoinducer 2 transporter [Deinococcus aetherius]